MPDQVRHDDQNIGDFLNYDTASQRRVRPVVDSLKRPIQVYCWHNEFLCFAGMRPALSVGDVYTDPADPGVGGYGDQMT